MKCPHCLISTYNNEEYRQLKTDTQGIWYIYEQICPNCNKNIISLEVNNTKFLVYPKASSRPEAPKETPLHIAEDYNEACLILSDSPKASAALSRRCLQTILREYKDIKKGSLDSEIEQALIVFPSHIADAIDAVRHIGNFAAHPIKSKSSGEIVNVEPGEAEWLLEVLEQLFDFCYVQPVVLQLKRDKLNQKLEDLGKPTLKTKAVLD